MQLRINFKDNFKKNKSSLIKIAEVGILVIVFFTIGIALGSYSFNSKPLLNADSTLTSTTTIDFQLLTKVYETIKQKSLFKNQISDKDLFYGTLRGMVESLNDPYSEFMTPDENNDFQSEISGKFEGIGIEMGLRDGVLTVIAPLENTPAQKAGLKAGDKILEVDGKSTNNLSLSEVQKLIRGPKGTKVNLTIENENGKNQVEITRDVIKITSVESKYLNNDIALLKIHNFYEPAVSEFRKEALKIFFSGKNKIILDLRDNPGGYFDSAIEIAGWFMPKGSIVAKENDGINTFVCDNCTTNGLGLFSNYKVVVLVNNGSASASEILAGALRDNRGIKIIGEKTFGKGTIQELIPLDNSASLKLTIAKWLTPNETDINETGIIPDIEIQNSTSSDKDLQLEKAIEIINTL